MPRSAGCRDSRPGSTRRSSTPAAPTPIRPEASPFPDALRQAARESGAEATVDAVESRRYPTEVETAVYFLWRTALDAVGTGGKARIRVEEEDEALQVTIEAADAVDLAPVSDVVEAARGVLAAAGNTVEARFELA